MTGHHGVPINNLDCGHHVWYVRGCRSCISAFRALTLAVPPDSGDPLHMTDRQLEDFYEFAEANHHGRG